MFFYGVEHHFRVIYFLRKFGALAVKILKAITGHAVKRWLVVNAGLHFLIETNSVSYVDPDVYLMKHIIWSGPLWQAINEKNAGGSKTAERVAQWKNIRKDVSTFKNRTANSFLYFYHWTGSVGITASFYYQFYCFSKGALWSRIWD